MKQLEDRRLAFACPGAHFRASEGAARGIGQQPRSRGPHPTGAGTHEAHGQSPRCGTDPRAPRPRPPVKLVVDASVLVAALVDRGPDGEWAAAVPLAREFSSRICLPPSRGSTSPKLRTAASSVSGPGGSGSCVRWRRSDSRSAAGSPRCVHGEVPDRGRQRSSASRSVSWGMVQVGGDSMRQPCDPDTTVLLLRHAQLPARGRSV